MCGIGEDSLSARGVDVPVASEHGRTSAVGARNAILVHVRTGGVVAPADGDVVDLVDRVGIRVVRAADAAAQELVPEVVALPDEGALHLVVPRGLVPDLALVARPEDVLAVDGYPRLVDVVPVGAPLQVPLVGARSVDDVGIDGIIWAATG